MTAIEKPSIDASTRLLAVYGHPISHSASPAMQNAALQILQLNWRYLAFDVHPDKLPEAIAGARAMNFIGLNLTVPHKHLALGLVDELDESARRWGAVNTIRFDVLDEQNQWRPLRDLEPGKIKQVRSVGFNTDADALVRSLREDLSIDVRVASILLLGAGGAGSVAALRLAQEGCKQLFLVNRTVSKAEEVARQIAESHPAVPVKVGYPSSSVDLVINATSLGLREADDLPLDEARFPLQQATAAYDMIYRPARTRFLERAQAAGCSTANGLGMLLYQGAKALEIWTVQPAPLAVMRRALHAAVYGD